MLELRTCSNAKNLTKESYYKASNPFSAHFSTQHRDFSTKLFDLFSITHSAPPFDGKYSSVVLHLVFY